VDHLFGRCRIDLGQYFETVGKLLGSKIQLRESTLRRTEGFVRGGRGHAWFLAFFAGGSGGCSRSLSESVKNLNTHQILWFQVVWFEVDNQSKQNTFYREQDQKSEREKALHYGSWMDQWRSGKNGWYYLLF